MELTKTNLNATVWVKPTEIEKHRKWYIVDAAGVTLGKLAVEIARRLQGKHQSYYCEFRDSGDYIIVINVDKLVVTGNKLQQKVYYKHTGYKGHLREKTLGVLMQKNPQQVVELAVKGMLPKNKHRAVRLKRLKLFKGDTHRYTHLSPESLDINGN